MTIDDIPVTLLDGTPTTLGQWSGRVRLIVNVASRCGFTPQYAALQAMHERYADRGFTVLGFPTNQFRQELRDADAIAEFCSTTYGVTFPVFAPVRVNGRSQHPLFEELTRVPDASGAAGRVRWNFEKFLLTPDGGAHRFRSRTEPDAPEVVALVEQALPVR